MTEGSLRSLLLLVRGGGRVVAMHLLRDVPRDVHRDASSRSPTVQLRPSSSAPLRRLARQPAASGSTTSFNVDQVNQESHVYLVRQYDEWEDRRQCTWIPDIAGEHIDVLGARGLRRGADELSSHHSHHGYGRFRQEPWGTDRRVPATAWTVSFGKVKRSTAVSQRTSQ